MWHKPVVTRVRHRRVQEAIDDQRPRVLVQLVLDGLAPNRNLDNNVDIIGGIIADSDGVYAHNRKLHTPGKGLESFYRGRALMYPASITH